ncbi:MAG: hypothetical protein Q9171_003971 [Xanthocarpia ochracea]
MKGLDDLIIFLLEEIALSGDHGTSTLEFISYVKAYYNTLSHTNEGQATGGRPTTLVDRKLLEKTWRWLTRHPEIQVGEDGRSNRLSLSEVEDQNALEGTAQRETMLDNVSAAPLLTQSSTPAKYLPNRRTNKSADASPSVKNAVTPTPSAVELRMYASTERRWQALAGHAFDRERIPRLDFACLSIIAVHKERGILQPELVRISGQDKRSVPQRTQRLQDGGYISKTPVLVNKAHTSKLTLKRYARDTAERKSGEEKVNDADTVLPAAENSVENPIDFTALHRKIFDILREVKLITVSELKDRIGVTGLKWPMRMLASHLRRLERIGCLKQVRAHPDTEPPSPFLFRCVRYIRDPEGKEWNPVNFRTRDRTNSTCVEYNEIGAPSDNEQVYLAEEARYLAGFSNNQQPKSLKEIERPMPQWSGDSTLSNLLYDITHAAGSKGISTMDLKDQSMGSFIHRPVEHHISRLVEIWQVSQPLHLRYLSIIRDAALTNGIPHFIHYSFENFKKLVDEGKASWDPVITVTKEHKEFRSVAAIDAQPDLDENGFPKISNSLFQGRHNDASLAECVQGADEKLPLLAAHDPRAVRSKGGDWIIQGYGAKYRYQVPLSRGRPKGTANTSRSEQWPGGRIKRLRKTGGPTNLVVSNLGGRGRQVPVEGFPSGYNRWSLTQKKKLLGSQRAAKRYKKSKLIEEINRRAKGGTDRYEATASVLILATEQYRGVGLEPPWDVMNEVKSDTLGPLLLALKSSTQIPFLNTALTARENVSETLNYKPSTVAHSRPLQPVERLLVERSLGSRVQIIQDVPIEDSILAAEHLILSKTMKQDQSDKRALSQPNKRKRVVAPSVGKAKLVLRNQLTEISPHSLLQPEGIAGQYLPSCAAHTWPLVLQKSPSDEAQLLKGKEVPEEDVQTKKPKRAYVKQKAFVFDPRIVARSTTSPGHTLHLQSYEQQLKSIPRPTPGFYVGQEAKLSQPGNRSGIRKSRLAVIKSSRIRDMTFISAQSVSAPLALTQVDRSQVQHPAQNIDGVYRSASLTPLLREIPSTQSYQQQLESIPRPTTGIHLGQEARLLRSGKRGRPCKSRLAVFKSPRIRDMACFFVQDQVAETALLDQPRVEHQAQNHRGNSMLASQHTESNSTSASACPALHISSACKTKSNPDLQSSLTPYGSAHSSSCTSGMKIGTGRKRKLTINDGQLATTSTDALALSSVDMCGASELCDRVAHDEASPSVKKLQSFSPLKGNRVSTLASESFEIRDHCTPRIQVPEISISSHPRDQPSTNSTKQSDDDSFTNAHFNWQHSASAVDDQNQFPRGGNINLNHLPQPQILGSQAGMTESGVEIAQSTQEPDYHEAYSIEISSGSPQLTSTRMISSVGEDLTTIRPSRELSVTSANDLSLQDVVGEPAQPNVKSGVRRVTLQGGTIAAQRRKIVMDIVEKCGGIYPGVPELCSPFREQWHKAGQSGRPETSTLRAAVKALCDNGSLRQLVFSFKDPRGLVITKTMVTKVGISPTDRSVIEMQNTIIGMYPSQYIPKETGLSDEARDTFWNIKGHAKMRTVKDLEVDINRVQMKQVPAYIENYGLKMRSRENRKAAEERQGTILRELMAAGRLPQSDGRSALGSIDTPYARDRLLSVAKRTMLKKPQRKVDRLESLKQKHARKPEGSSSFAPTDEQAETDLHPTNMSSANGTVPGEQSHAQFKKHFTEQTKKRLAELQQGRQQDLSNRLDFSRMLTTENFDADLAAQMLDENLRQMELDSITESIEVSSPARRRPFRPPRPRGRQECISEQHKAARPCQKSGPNSTAEVLTFQLSKHALISHRNSPNSDLQSPEARQQMYTIMEPEHFFHPATGTFAVNFSRWRTVNQIRQRYHWQGSSAKDFVDHVDDLMTYELKANGLEDAIYNDWPFINYTFPHDHRTTSEQGPSTRTSWYSKIGGSRGYERIASGRSSRSTSTDPSALPSLQGSMVPSKRKRGRSGALEPLKRRRLTTVARLLQHAKPRVAGDTSGKLETSDRSRKKMVIRRERVLTADQIRRILIAVVVIRTLTGGVDRHIDWVLVTKVFEPDHDQAYIQKKWPKVLQAHKLQAQQLQENFQALFLQAYKDGLVPPLDYDDLQAYDWTWLVNWTIGHIETPISGALDLPSQRDRLDNLFHLSVGDDNNLHAYYEFDGGSSILRREMELHKKAWVQSLTNDTEAVSDAQTETLETVKTWIRANVATKARTYNPRSARDKLAQFDAKLIDQALKEMLGDRVLITQNKGRLMPGRNYDLSEQYLKPLKKRIEAAKFLQAPIIKREMDKTLAEEGQMIVSELADDAFMIVMQNMQAHRRLSLVALDPPMKKFGLTDDGSYKIRMMDKRKLHFSVGIRATDSYVEGNPLWPLPKPPLSSQIEKSMLRIPLWYDINGDVIPELWQLALAATMSILVMRPGITARVLEPSVRTSLALWEVQMVLDWMVEARAATKTDDTYAVEEWWWMCLDNDFDVERDAREKEKNSEVWVGQKEV